MKVDKNIIGNTYLISGDIENGYKDGKPNINHAEVTRKVTGVTETHLICECGRRFLINDNLKITDTKTSQKI